MSTKMSHSARPRNKSSPGLVQQGRDRGHDLWLRPSMAHKSGWRLRMVGAGYCTLARNAITSRGPAEMFEDDERSAVPSSPQFGGDGNAAISLRTVLAGVGRILWGTQSKSQIGSRNGQTAHPHWSSRCDGRRQEVRGAASRQAAGLKRANRSKHERRYAADPAGFMTAPTAWRQPDGEPATSRSRLFRATVRIRDTIITGRREGPTSTVKT